MKTDNLTIPKNENYRKARLKQWADRRKRFQDMYGSQPAGQYQTCANPTPSFRDWKVDPRSLQIVAHTDYLQPEFQIHRYGGSMVLRESDILAGGKSLAQECRIPVRDENGLFVGYQDELDQERKAA